MLALPSEPVWLEQIHSNRAVKAVKTASLQQADASYTNESGVVCAVMTADCLPLLVCSMDGTQVAAIHAGWRGLLAGVISNTVNAMQITPNSPRCKSEATEDFLVWLGPAIGPDCFEVGAEVRDAFLEKSAEFSSAFKKQGNDKWLADIYQLARIELATLGIATVYGGTHCTVTEHERFYSYRRETQTGRMATLIWRE
jgi:YfiH family protein